MYVVCRSETVIKSVRCWIASISNFQIITYIILPIAYEVSTYSGFQSKWSCMYYFHQIMGRSVKLRGKNRTYLECALWNFSDNVVGQGELLEACDWSENFVTESPYPVVIGLQSLQCWQSSEGRCRKGEHFVVTNVQVFKVAQTLEGVVFNLIE